MVKFAIPKKPPIGIDALVREVMDTEVEQVENLQLSIFLDDSASGDLIAIVRSAFADSAANVRITISYVGTVHAIPDPSDDMAVIVAGDNAQTAELFQANREAGVPCMIVTMDAVTTMAMCAEQGISVDVHDVISAEKADGEPLAKAETQNVLDRMGKWICSTCQDKSLSFARSFAFTRRPLSIDCVNLTALENGFIGLLILKPGTNLPIMTANQMKMFLQIAAAYNQPMNAERLPELASVLATAYMMRGFSYKAAADVPALSMIVRGAIGYATTLCLGRTAVLYFENGGGVSGLAKTINNARETIFSHITRTRAGLVEEPVSDAEEEKPQPKDKLVSLGKTALAAGTAVGNVAAPLMKSAAVFGADSFKSSIKGLID